MRLPKQIEFILQRLYEAGFEGYVVGGAVRDYLLGKVPHDFDVTTSATPDEISNIFHDVHQVKHGLKHGTIALILDGELYEVTTFRTEEGYSDHRRPDKVKFVTELEDDLARRDFTINALAYYNKVYDYFGGVEDLKSKVIRAVGNPHERFSEDALRIFRALRFSAQLGFVIDPLTKKAIFDLKHTVVFISIERVQSEITKMLLGNLAYVFPEFFSVFEEIIPDLKNSNQEEITSFLLASPVELSLRLFLLISSLPDPIMIARKLKYSRLVVRRISILKRYSTQEIPTYKVEYRQLLQYVTYDEARLILEHHKLLGREVDFMLLESVKEDCTSLKQLAVDGHDMMELGVRKTSINTTLQHLLNQVIEEKLENQKEVLLEYVKQNLIR